MRHISEYKLYLVISIFFSLALTSCSTEEVNDEIVEESIADGTDDPEENTDPEENPETGAITFDDNFDLSEERSFTNFVLSNVEYNKFITGEGDLRLVTEKAYEYLNDSYDFIIILSVEASQPDDLFFGRFTPVSNGIEGIGGNTFNNAASYGSEGKLKGIMYMPRSEYVRNGPFLHEIAHAWANKNFLPTTVGGHWGYAGVGGQLGGFDELVSLGGNSYQGRLNNEDGFGTFANGGNSIAYGNLELYLMGLIGPEELEAIQVAENPQAGGSFGQFTADAITVYSPQEMIANNGERVPSHQNSQKEYRALTVIISREKLEADKMENIHSNLENFSRQAEPDASWGSLHNFWKATQGKASFSFDVLPAHIK
ncbi:hypothetical protein [uncultured Croceitalea sp.]|uniref:hypothetical protein n=1 Tax=uncultured Croceitalea sp. TaxID=1798908 RepID=UPI003305912E